MLNYPNPPPTDVVGSQSCLGSSRLKVENNSQTSGGRSRFCIPFDWIKSSFALSVILLQLAQSNSCWSACHAASKLVFLFAIKAEKQKPRTATSPENDGQCTVRPESRRGHGDAESVRVPCVRPATPVVSQLVGSPPFELVSCSHSPSFLRWAKQCSLLLKFMLKNTVC
jgi:hypothetical protein